MGKWTQAAAKKAAAISAAGVMLTDGQAYTVPAIFMPWKEAVAYAVGDRVRYNGLLYKCLQAHTSLSVWTPDAAASLWSRIDDPAIAWPEWRQPTGASDAYAIGARVSHNAKRWISTVAANVWEPGVYGWSAQV